MILCFYRPSGRPRARTRPTPASALAVDGASSRAMASKACAVTVSEFNGAPPSAEATIAPDAIGSG
jgi:hypothetical protein